AYLIAGLPAYVEPKNAGNHDHGLRSVAVLEHCELHRFGASHEQPTAKAALILDNPIAAAVLADSEQGLGTNHRGRFTFIIHGTSPSTIELRRCLQCAQQRI